MNNEYILDIFTGLRLVFGLVEAFAVFIKLHDDGFFGCLRHWKLLRIVRTDSRSEGELDFGLRIGFRLFVEKEEMDIYSQTEEKRPMYGKNKFNQKKKLKREIVKT